MAAAGEKRFVFVDALRGIAALAVVLDHVYAKNLAFSHELPEPLHTIFANGGLGVYVFFALSGFVISHAVGDARITPSYFGRFALRRSLRLDPPYWATIALALVVTVASNHVFKDRVLPLPSVPAVAAHVVYLQAILGYEHILGVFWTLCYEIQFYLLYVLLLGIAQRLAGPSFSARRWALVLFLSTAVLGVVVNSEAVPALTFSHAWCLRAWPCFLLGAAARATVVGQLPRAAFAALLAGGLVLAAVLSGSVSGDAAVGIVATGITAGALVVAEKNLGTWTLGRPLQLLGRISYSLYLTHMVSGSRAARIAQRVLGHGAEQAMGAGALWVSLIASVAVAIGCAALWYLVVEGPSHRFSRRVKLGSAA